MKMPDQKARKNFAKIENETFEVVKKQGKSFAPTQQTPLFDGATLSTNANTVNGIVDKFR